MMMLRISFLISVLFLSACSFSIHTSGGAVLLQPQQVLSPSLPEQVTLYIEQPDAAYDVVALVQASADVMDYGYIAEYETAVLQELRQQAANVGAHGVIEIVREVVSDGAMVTTDSYGSGWNIKAVPDEPRSSKFVQHHSTQSSKVSQQYTVYFRGKAIRLKP